jgi:hypothetical protein
MIPDDNLQKIALLIGMLGSAHDGEVLNAARAIGRQLAACDQTWGDLKTCVLQVPEYPDPRRHSDILANMAEEILEQQFVNCASVRDVRARLTSNPDYRMSEKQSRWFSHLYSKLA